MSKESVIVLESYEKHSFFRFFFIFITVFLSLFLALASLYYYKESHRYFQEQKLQNKIIFAECEHLFKLLPSSKECIMEPVNIDEKLTKIHTEIAVTFFITLLLIVPFAYFLARLSLRPMRQSVETMDSFINGIVHDINTPLSIIRINAQSMQKRLSEQKLIEKNARIIQGADHIEALEAQLLFMLRIHNYEPQYSDFDLYALLLQRLAYWSDIRRFVTITLEGETTLVTADIDAITRMIDNMVLNAIKYSPAHSDVKITCKNNLLRIEDQGEGIKNPKEVFNKYYRESKHTKGLGLGLYVVKAIASMHRLEIDIDSVVNRGTTFSILLTPISTLHKEYING
jgi:two-component system OmpR family sensor kinase